MSIDTVSDIPPRVQYIASALQLTFDYPFPIFTNADLTVVVDGVTKVLTTDYSVSGATEDTGGTVTFGTVMTGGETVTIYRDTAVERTTDFSQNGAFSSSTFNDELDKFITIAQELKSSVKRALRFDVDSPATDEETLLSPTAAWAGKYIYINASGKPEPVAAAASTVTMTRANIGSTFIPLSLAESAAGVTPTNYYEAYRDVRRYGFNAADTTSDQSTALTRAYNVAVENGGGYINIPESDFRATITISHQGIVFQGCGGTGSQTIWRNVGATSPLTFSNASRGIVDSGVKDISFVNRDSAVYTSTDGIKLTSEATGLMQMDYLIFENVYSRNFRDGVSINGRLIWTDFSRVRCEGNLRDGWHIEGSDNISQNNWRLCRGGNSGRHGFYANLTFANLLATGNKFDTCTFEQNEVNGVRITGTVGLSGWTFDTCYMEENAGSVAAGSTSPRKVNAHVDCVYAINLSFNGVTFYGNTAPDVNPDRAIYVDTAGMTEVSGTVSNCRDSSSTVGSVYWPRNVRLSKNTFTGTSVYTSSLNSSNDEDQTNLTAWTPALSFGGGTTGIVATNAVGRYTAHGRLITAVGYYSISSKGSSTGVAKITGLPVAATNVTNLQPTFAVAADGLSGAYDMTARVIPNTTTAQLYRMVSGALTAVTDADLSGTVGLSFTAVYFS